MIYRLLAWLFPPSLLRLEARAAKIGTLTLQQIEGPEHLYWTAALRAGRPGYNGPRYSWTAQGDDLHEALSNVLEQAREYKINAKPLMPHAPKLGGKTYDE